MLAAWAMLSMPVVLAIWEEEESPNAAAMASYLEDCIDRTCRGKPCNHLEEKRAKGCAQACDLLPSNPLGQIGRSSRVGRALWCLANSQYVRRAADLFAATAGAGILIADGLRAKGGSLVLFEREPEVVRFTFDALREYGAEVITVPSTFNATEAGAKRCAPRAPKRRCVDHPRAVIS